MEFQIVKRESLGIYGQCCGVYAVVDHDQKAIFVKNLNWSGRCIQSLYNHKLIPIPVEW
jgi:hypothetical protein